VSAATTCWPLGLRLEATAPEHCQRRLTGWVLQQTAPPTLPDRGRSGGLLARACTGDALKAHWPVALAPWADDGDACQATPAMLRIQGLETRAVLKPVPGQHSVAVAVTAQGAPREQRLYWLVDGLQQRRAAAGQAVTLQFDQAGRHSVTVLDEQGRFHRIEVSVEL